MIAALNGVPNLSILDGWWPEGCEHGYQTLEDNSEVFYLNSQIYNLDSEKGIKYSDPAFNISFPLDVTEISKKDSAWKLFGS